MKTGIELIADERNRQHKLGWTDRHDDKHIGFELTRAAVSYAQILANPDEWAEERGMLPSACDDWPWLKAEWKPSKDPIRNLVKAGALIAAEIDRLQRAKKRKR